LDGGTRRKKYYLSCWYKRSELGMRAAIFFSAAAFAGSFGGLLAAAIQNMHGVGGKPGWAWIFILEVRCSPVPSHVRPKIKLAYAFILFTQGLATVIVGLGSYLLVHDFPDQAKFLSADERLRVQRRLAADRPAGVKQYESFDMAFFWQSVKDWKTWMFALVYMGTDGSLYAFSLFLPTIIKQMGNGSYSATHANLLSVPPYAAAAIMTVLVGWYADRTGRRGACNIAASLLGIAGFVMLLGAREPGVKYAGTFLGAMGIYPTIANTISWCSNNVEGVYKRGVTLGIVIGWGNLNGVVASNIYPTKDAPNYYRGHGTVLGYLVVFLFGGSVVNTVLLRAENRKRMRGERDGWRAKSARDVEVMGDERFGRLMTGCFGLWLTCIGPTSFTWCKLSLTSG
jgi:MFS family permease